MMMKVKQHRQMSAMESKQQNKNTSSSKMNVTVGNSSAVHKSSVVVTSGSETTKNKRSSSMTTTTAGSTLSNATPDRLESSASVLIDDNNDYGFNKIEMDFNDALLPNNDLFEKPPIFDVDDDGNSIKLDKIMSLASPASQFEPRKVSITSNNKSTADGINLLNDELNLEDIFPLPLTDDKNDNDDDNNSNINNDDSFTIASFNDSSTAVDRLFLDDSDRSMDKLLDDIIDVDEKINATAKADFVPSNNSYNSSKKGSMVKSIVDDKLSQLPQNMEQEKSKLLQRLMNIEQQSSSEDKMTGMGKGTSSIQQATSTPMVVVNSNINSNSMSSINYYYNSNSNKNINSGTAAAAETPLQIFLRSSKETSARRRNSMGAMTSSSCATNLPLHTPYTTTAMANQQDRRRIMRRNSLNSDLYQSAGMVTSTDNHHRIVVPKRRASIGAGAAKVQNRRLSLSRSNSGFGSLSLLKTNRKNKNKKNGGKRSDLLDKGSSHSHKSLGSNDSGFGSHFPTKRRGSCGSSHGGIIGGKYKLGGGPVRRFNAANSTATANNDLANNGIIYAGNQQQIYQKQNDNGWPVESSSGSIAVNMLM